MKANSKTTKSNVSVRNNVPSEIRVPHLIPHLLSSIYTLKPQRVKPSTLFPFVELSRNATKRTEVKTNRIINLCLRNKT